ncbi:MAG: DUF4281 domain-containing protein [Burkholderiaceae bacterium]|nr:DUF4281 domain-containing protein [Burkholderiaceae bacterium]
MSLETSFSLASTIAMLGWLVLLAGLWAPGRWRPPLLWVGGRAVPLLLSAGYAVALARHWGAAPGGGFGSLAEVAALFSAPGLLLAGWVHYLAFDLFVGRWIVDETLAHRLSRTAALPSLVLTFLAGPVGLLLHFGLRSWQGWRGPAQGAGHAV